MTTLAGWQDAYYCVGTTSITESPDFSTSTCLGTYGEGKPQTFTLNHPDFECGLEIIESEKDSSFAYTIKGGTNRIERTPGVLFPNVPFETSLDCLSGFIPLLTLFQMPTTGFDDETYKTFIPYSSNSIQYFASLLRTTEEGKSYNVIGAIAQVVTLSGMDGEEAKIATDWAGADISTGASSSVVTWAPSYSRTPLLFQNLTCAYDSTSQTMDLESFEIVITNNAKHPTYNSTAVSRHILGDLEVSGTIRVPWSSTIGGQNEFISKMLAGDTITLYIWWGNRTPSTDGDFSITLNIELDSSNTNSSDNEEAVNEVAFVGVYNGTNYPIQIDSYFGDVYPTYTTFTVLDSGGSSYDCTNVIIDSGGDSMYVSRYVADADGTLYDCT